MMTRVRKYLESIKKIAVPWECPAHCTVLEESLPHVCRQPLVRVSRGVRLHYGVVDERGEVRADSRQVTAVRQPWLKAAVMAAFALRMSEGTKK